MTDPVSKQSRSGNPHPVNAGKGRKKGSPNRITMEVKESVEQVFEQLGSVEAYLNWAATNPDAFYNNHWIKLLPKNLTVDAQVRVEHLFNPDQLRRMADLQEED